jgi:hypothetical protein
MKLRRALFAAPAGGLAAVAMLLSAAGSSTRVAPRSRDSILSLPVRATRIVPMVVAASVLFGVAAAEASSGAAPRDGYYAPLGTSVGSADVELFVVDKGKRLADSQTMTVGLSCPLDPAEEAEGLNPAASFVNVYLPLGLKLPITGLSFSYSGPAYLLPSEVPAGVTQPPGTITINGTFKPASQIKGKHVDNKTVAFKGTVSATLCPSIPTTFTDYWSVNDL